MATPKKHKRLPKMGRHSSGQARIKLNGRIHYLGKFGSIEAQRRYTELVERWEKGGRRPLDPLPTTEQVQPLRDLFDRYQTYLDETGRYRKGGKPTSQRGIAKKAIDEFLDQFGDVLVPRFSEALLLQHRDSLEKRRGLTRGGINKKVAHLRAALRWAWGRGLLSRDQWLGVKAIEPLRRSETAHRDRKRRKRAVTMEEVEAVAKHLPRVPAAMLRLQALTGMRPGEVCAMRWCDIDRTPVTVDGIECWTYVVAEAKTAHHGHETRYALAAKARIILDQFPPRSPVAYVFSPQATMLDLHDARRADRRAPMTKQTRDRDEAPGREFSDRYSTPMYRQAIGRGIKRAKVSPFSPHEIRHGAITRACARFGAFAASVFANHSRVSTTEGYLHAPDLERYRVAVGLAANARDAANSAVRGEGRAG